MSKLGDVLSKLVYVKRITDGGLGAEPLPPEAVGVQGGEAPQPWGGFWKKITILKSLNHVSHVFRAI